ncbi:cofilin/tropomyosin-type actin-binding protein [Paraphaeosphaeria sporulosa]
MEISPEITEAFTAFVSDSSLFALPLTIANMGLQALSPIPYPEDTQHTFQQALNRLDSVLNPKRASYLVLRVEGSLVAITFVPYVAIVNDNTALLENRQLLLETLGEQHFSASIICKEMGEVVDARSWDERSGEGHSWNRDYDERADGCERDDETTSGVHDLGYKKNKCRLCDRRMKNNIDDAALSALKSLVEGGGCSVNVSTEILQLNFRANDLAPADVASRLPTDKPSFTFYRHASNHRLYFIFCAPDSANVKERMKHTMAIPGLINIIAKDNSVSVDQKLEIHDPEELDFEQKDERIGKFRSMYLRNEWAGTESQWAGMEAQQKILDAIR